MSFRLSSAWIPLLWATVPCIVPLLLMLLFPQSIRFRHFWLCLPESPTIAAVVRKAGSRQSVHHILDAAHPTALTSLSVDAKAGSSLTIVQVLRGDAEHGAAASLTRIRAGENAQVRLVQIQLLGDNARRWNAAAVEEGRNARVEQVRIELGGILSACGTRAALSAAKSEYDLDAVYFGSGSALLDYNDVSVHTAKDTMCEMLSLFTRS